MAKRLIVTADDMGLSRATTDAIFEAFQHGIVTSASLIVNLPGADYAFERLRATPGLDVGVHLNISGGFPITLARKIPSLVTSGGTFFPFEILKRRLWRGSVSSRDIEAEFRAQIRKMKDHGVTPTHANSHNHVHFHPLVARAFTRALLSEGITRARAPRHRHYPPNNQIGGACSHRCLSRPFAGIGLRAGHSPGFLRGSERKVPDEARVAGSWMEECLGEPP
jgi:predicted glycoside hydrolase/deacetylase ChbG (UPF0249 family)